MHNAPAGDIILQAQLGGTGLDSEQGDADHRGENREPNHHFRGDRATLTR
jgi:hypothetical protein